MSQNKMKIGVLALQGDFKEHSIALNKLGITAVEVRKPSDLKDVSGLILPGGESTTISKLLKTSHLDAAIAERSRKGLPIYGTCAGAIILAKKITDSTIPTLGLLDVEIARNNYGRQIDSFEAKLNVESLGNVEGVFIRAPIIKQVFNGAKILAEFDGNPVMLQDKNILITTFHPELTDDTKVHEYFLNMVKKRIN